MRIIKCNVQNFGTLCAFKYEFDSGLTVIKEENGFGKSTLATFIKAMFYGLPQSAKRDLDKNERKKYTPWQGGSFGGSLEFETGDKKYRIERFFAAKEKDDSFKLYDLNLGHESADYSANIGFELFGIDAESFERSIYMPQNSVTTAVNNSLRAKLTGLVENSDDMNNYDKAMELLDKKKRVYSYQKGAKGGIADKNREIDGLNDLLNDRKAAEENGEAVMAEIKALTVEECKAEAVLSEIEKKIDIASLQQASAERDKRRAEYGETLRALNAESGEISLKYPQGFPSDGTFSEMSDCIKELARQKSEADILSLDNGDEAELRRLTELLGEAAPTSVELDEKREEFSYLTQKKMRVEALEKELATAPKSGGVSAKTVTAIFCLSGAVAVLGAVLSTLSFNIAVGIALLALGLIGLGATAFVRLKNMISSGNKPNYGILNTELEVLKAECESENGAIHKFTSRFFPDVAPEKALDMLTQALRDTERLKKSETERQAKLSSRKRKAEECETLLKRFFGEYYPDSVGDYDVRLNEIKRDAERATRISTEINMLGEKLNALPPKTEEVPDAVLDKNALSTEKVAAVVRLDAIRSRLSREQSNYTRLSADAEGIAELEEQIESAKSEVSEMTERFEVLSKTEELLEKAKTELSAKYLDPMTAGFTKYAAILGVPADDVMIATDLTVKLEKMGAGRDRESFSTGIKDMTDIALRLSLSEALFQSEPPILILDDPFVNLDDVRIKEALGLLEKLSDKCQIIYLTCHSSRAI